MSVSPQQLSFAAPVPLIIGVTGHRDLRPADIPQLQSQIEQIIRDLLNRYPNTTLLVLSPLAEGADRLVAKVALDQGAKLAVPLPLQPQEYEKDFLTEPSRKEFQDLLKQAWKCFELPLLHGNTLASIKEYGAARDKQYALVGAYVAQHSHILIALWDGTNTGSVGGTGQIVDFKLNGIPEPYAAERKPLDIIDNGPVYHIVTPRIKNSTPSGKLFNLSIKFPEGWESEEGLEKSFGRILKQMDSFNRDARRLANRLAGEIQKNRGYVIPESELPELAVGARFILDQYALADSLAIHYQKRRSWTLFTLFVIAVLAVLSFEVYAHLISKPLVLMLYPLTLLSAVCFYALAQWKGYQNKHLDYRALAEGLRVQLFWNIAGLSEDVAEHYLRQHRTELDWIRNAIRAWNVVARNSCDPKMPAPEITTETHARKVFQLVIQHWIKDQGDFFERSRKRDHNKLKKYERRAKALFVFGLALAILVVGWHLLYPELAEHSHGRHWLIVIMGITPAIAAALGGYAEKMAYSAQAKRYDWMSSLFNRAAKQVDKLLAKSAHQAMELSGSDTNSGDPRKKYSSLQSLFLDLGSEALEENGDWVMMHRERTVDVYKGP